MDHTSTQPPAGNGTGTGRRGFFRWLTDGLCALAGVFLAAPVLGYLFQVPKGKAQWVPVGKVEDFRPDQTQLVTFSNPLKEPWAGITALTGVYVRKEGKDRFLVFAVNCAHLGCPVSWFPQSGLFMCPCHGGVYYASGERASGPPPRGLFHCVWRVRDGELEIEAPHYPTEHDRLEKPA